MELHHKCFHLLPQSDSDHPHQNDSKSIPTPFRPPQAPLLPYAPVAGVIESPRTFLTIASRVSADSRTSIPACGTVPAAVKGRPRRQTGTRSFQASAASQKRVSTCEVTQLAATPQVLPLAAPLPQRRLRQLLPRRQQDHCEGSDAPAQRPGFVQERQRRTPKRKQCLFRSPNRLLQEDAYRGTVLLRHPRARRLGQMPQ